MNKLIINGKEIDLTEVQVKSIQQAVLLGGFAAKEPERLTWDEISGGYQTCFAMVRGGLTKTTNIYDKVRDGIYLPTERLALKSAAINKLLTIAHYLNKGWEPDWGDYSATKWIIEIAHDDRPGRIEVDRYSKLQSAITYFQTRELAQQAIDILGEEVIKTALS